MTRRQSTSNRAKAVIDTSKVTQKHFAAYSFALRCPRNEECVSEDLRISVNGSRAQSNMVSIKPFRLFVWAVFSSEYFRVVR